MYERQRHKGRRNVWTLFECVAMEQEQAEAY